MSPMWASTGGPSPLIRTGPPERSRSVNQAHARKSQPERPPSERAARGVWGGAPEAGVPLPLGRRPREGAC